MKRILELEQQAFPLKQTFRIAHGAREQADVVYVRLTENNKQGEGESVPYARYRECCESVLADIQSVKGLVEAGLSRAELQAVLPAGAARNALDNALWALEAEQTGQALWQLADLPEPKPVQTAYTLVIDAPQVMAQRADELKKTYPLLKLKLAGDGQDAERLLAVRQAAPDNRLVIDANESWQPHSCAALIQVCQQVGVEMIEQPFPAGQDASLHDLDCGIAICADESCHTVEDLPALQGKYDIVNIKLDKTGGLTQAIELMYQAKAMQFQTMVGCMVGSSLAILPAFYLAQCADWVDLDAPLLLKSDRVIGGSPLLQYSNNLVVA